MAAETLEQTVNAAVEPVLSGMGFRIVELKAVQTKRTFQVHLVIYRNGGVTLNDCTLVTKTVLPRLQVTLGAPELHMEVSSPGTERTLRHEREYEIFKGRGIRILRKNENDWLSGLIAGCDDKGVTVSMDTRDIYIPYGEIIKARLDDAREVG
jgi:ribosome maturation factor RimP